MNEQYTNSIIDTALTYLYNLRYLARQNPLLVKDLNLFIELHKLYSWADWAVTSEENKIHIQKLMDCLILRNSDITFPTIIPGTYYSNVSTPQTMWTWQRVWDNLEVQTENDLIPT